MGWIFFFNSLSVYNLVVKWIVKYCGKLFFHTVIDFSPQLTCSCTWSGPIKSMKMSTQFVSMLLSFYLNKHKIWFLARKDIIIYTPPYKIFENVKYFLLNILSIWFDGYSIFISSELQINFSSKNFSLEHNILHRCIRKQKI